MGVLDARGNALHRPVLRDLCVELLSPALSEKNSICVDCTLGLGGHTEAILRSCPEVTVVGIDRDPQAIELASRRLAPFGGRFIPVRATYDGIADICAQYAPEGKAQAVLMDLGVSSLQLDARERGFSYAHDAPLDMRMDPDLEVSAADIVNNASAGELTRILKVYGEEKFASRIAGEIVSRRARQPFTGTGELVEAVRRALPARAVRTGGNPAKRTFQAIRMAVNSELEVLQRALCSALDVLAVHGRMAVESYHSLEDRIVKNAFRRGLEDTTPAGLPVRLEEHSPYLRELVHGAFRAPETEIARNPRSASVRLRAVERIRRTPAHLHHTDTKFNGGHA